jgi:microtubule-associated protein, RP/EB family
VCEVAQTLLTVKEIFCEKLAVTRKKKKTLKKYSKMSKTTVSFGMMEGAFFVGRFELLNWLNELLQLDYTKVEQCANGAAYVQIMDAVLPGRVPLQKVNFDAKFDYDFVKNYKVLTTVFENNGIDKLVDVPRLIKGKYQDNLEFLQWIKRFYDIHANQEEVYNAAERRESSRANKAANRANARPAAPAPPAKQPAPALAAAAKPRAAGSFAQPTQSSARAAPAPPTRPAASAAAARGAAAVAPVAAAAAAAGVPQTALQRQVADLTKELADMQQTIDALEKERDFYFGKLRAVEIVCQDLENAQPGLAKPVFAVLYDAADDDEVSVNM